MLSNKIDILLRPFRRLFGTSGPAKSRKIRTIIIVASVLIFLYTITGFFILPPIIKKIAREKLTEQLGRKVSIESVSLNPYSFSARIRGFEIKESDSSTTFLSFSSLYVDWRASSVYRKGPVIREIKLEKPYVHIVRLNANAYNFTDIIEKFLSTGETVTPKKPEKPLLFSISNIQVTNGEP